MKPAAAYLRVSTEAQSEGYGLPAQREAIEAYCKVNGLEVVQEYEDAGFSGASADRPALGQLLADISAFGPIGENHPKPGLYDAPRFELVVVAKWDRLARDTTLDGYLRYHIEQSGCRIVSATETNGIDPISKMTQAILAAVAQYERSLIAARMHGGRKIKKAKGGYAGGAKPYGWRAVGNGLLEPIAEEQAVLALILQQRKDEQLSTPRIAALLNEAGIPTPRGGKEWRASSVRSVLKTGRIAA